MEESLPLPLQFLAAWIGMDFFTVEVLTVRGSVRYHVLFVIDIGSRIVEVVGLARDPGGDTKQMARNLLDRAVDRPGQGLAGVGDGVVS